MKKFTRVFAWILPLVLSACFHRPHQAKNPPVAPPIELPTQPVITPEPPPVQTTTPAETTPAQSTPAPAPATESRPPEEATKPPAHHKKRATKSVPPAQEAPAPETANTGGVSAVGTLSAGDASNSRQATEDLINATERGLKGINRALSEQEQKTAGQITEFLKQARAALASGDVDGANTLALKAKVLLSELSH